MYLAQEDIAIPTVDQWRTIDRMYEASWEAATLAGVSEIQKELINAVSEIHPVEGK